MEELMKEVHALVPRGPTIKESRVFMTTFEQLLINGSERRMPKTRCWATPQRWLFTLDMISLRAVLWNPSNLEKVELPSFDKSLPRNCKCLLSCEPVSPGCVVLLVDADEPVIWFCHVGGKEWTRHEYNITVETKWLPIIRLRKRKCEGERAYDTSHEEASSEFIIFKGDDSVKRTIISADGHAMAIANLSERFLIRSIAAVEGKFYFDISSSKLGVLEFVPDPSFTTIELDSLYVSHYHWELASPHLVESRGRLYLAVHVQKSPASMALYKMDFSRLAWSRVDGLYDQVFFLGRLHFTASYSAWELGLKQGNIYYIEDEGEVELLNVFFLGDKDKPCSNYYVSLDNLPAPLLSIRSVLTKACGFTIGSSILAV